MSPIALSTSPPQKDEYAPSEPRRPEFSIASLSLGTSVHHSLPTKLETAARLGYDSIEIFTCDFDAFVQEVGLGDHQNVVIPSSLANVRSVADFEYECARGIGALSSRLGLKISCYQPFRNFENFPGASSSSSLPALLIAALERAERHLRLMPAFKTDLLLVCSNFLPSNPIESGRATWEQYRDDQIVAFRALGRLAARYNVRIGYEPLSWGTVVNRWEQVWEVVKAADMPNVGVILDSFNCLGKQWADPESPSGRLPVPTSLLAANLLTMSYTIPASKLFFYQVADAGRAPSPITTLPRFPALQAWSRKTRLFPQEGYLPVELFTDAVLRIGYTGPWSLEVFNSSLEDPSPSCVVEHGMRGLKGLQGLWDVTGARKAQCLSRLVKAANAGVEGEAKADIIEVKL